MYLAAIVDTRNDGSTDIYIFFFIKAEEQGFSRFHIYVCAAFLAKWSDQLVKMDFQVC